MGRKNNLTTPNKAWGDLKYSNYTSEKSNDAITKNVKQSENSSNSSKTPMPNAIREEPVKLNNNSNLAEEAPYSVRVDAKEFTESMKPMMSKILNDLKKNNLEHNIRRDAEHRQTLKTLTIVTIGSLLCSLIMAFICLSTVRSISKLVQFIQEK
jgi:hypothetical protein